jgi:hypothetical protein
MGQHSQEVLEQNKPKADLKRGVVNLVDHELPNLYGFRCQSNVRERFKLITGVDNPCVVKKSTVWQSLKRGAADA